MGRREVSSDLSPECALAVECDDTAAVPDPRHDLPAWLGPVILILLSGFLCFYRLGSNGVHEQDEAWHADAAFEFARDGNFWRPTQFGRPYYEKPALLVWMVGGAYRMLGPTAWAARGWPALFAVATVLSTYGLAAHVITRRTGLLAGVALATSYLFVYRHCARAFEFDSLLLFAFVLSTWLFVRAVSTGRGWLAWSAATALASYGKNFAAAVPALVFLLTLLISRPAHRPTLRQWLRLGLLFAALHLAWFIPMIIVQGRPFLANFVGHQVLGRAGIGRDLGLASIVSIDLRVLAAGFFPWFVLGIAALPDALARARGRDPGRVVLVVWLAVFGVLLCAMLRQSLSWYVLPLCPFMAIVGAAFVLDASDRPRWLRQWRAAALLVLIAMALALRLQPELNPFALWSQDRRLSLTWNSGPQFVAVAAALLVAWWWLRNAAAASAVAMTVNALISVVQPLSLAGHQNVYIGASTAIAKVSDGRAPHLSVNLARSGIDRLTRYYLALLRPARASYHWSRRTATLESARRMAAPAFAVLVARRPIGDLPDGYPGTVIFEGAERGGARETYFVKVVHIDEPERGASDAGG